MRNIFFRITVYLLIGLISDQVDGATFTRFRPSGDLEAPVYDFLNFKNRESQGLYQVENSKYSIPSTHNSIIPLQDPALSIFEDKAPISEVIKKEEEGEEEDEASSALSISQIINGMAKLFKSTITKENILSGIIIKKDKNEEDEQEEEEEENAKQPNQNSGLLSNPTDNSNPSTTNCSVLLVTDKEENEDCDCDEEEEEKEATSNSWLLSSSASNSGLPTILSNSGLSVPSTSVEDGDIECDEDEDENEDEEEEEGKEKETQSSTLGSSQIAISESLAVSGNISGVFAPAIVAPLSSGINTGEVLGSKEDTDEDDEDEVEDEDEEEENEDETTQSSIPISLPSNILGSLTISDIISEASSPEWSSLAPPTELGGPVTGVSSLEKIPSLIAPASIAMITEEALEPDDDDNDDDEEEEKDIATQSSIFVSAPAVNSGSLSISQTISEVKLSETNEVPVTTERYHKGDKIENIIDSVAAPILQSSSMSTTEPTIMSLIPPFYFVTSTTPAPKTNIFSGNECRDPNVPNGKHIPYPGDCNKFIHCDNYKAWVKNCGVGLHFNRFVQVCDWPANARCI